MTYRLLTARSRSPDILAVLQIQHQTSEITVGEFCNVRDETNGEIVVSDTVSQGAFCYNVKGIYAVENKVPGGSLKKSRPSPEWIKSESFSKKRTQK